MLTGIFLWKRVSSLLKNFLIRLRYLNIWSLAQVGIIFITCVSFILITYYGFTNLLVDHGNIYIEKDFESVKLFMNETEKQLLDKTDHIARIFEAGNLHEIKNVDYSITNGRAKVAINFIFIVNKDYKLLFSSNDNSNENFKEVFTIPIVREALKDKKICSFEKIPYAFLKKAGFSENSISNALVRVAAVPYYNKGHQEGIVVTGIIVNNNNFLPNWFKNKHNGKLSFFLDGHRIATIKFDKSDNLLPGTALPLNVYQSMYINKKPFQGIIDLGRLSVAKYEFLYNAENKPVAVIGIAKDYGQFAVLFSNMGIFIWVIAVILGVLMFFTVNRLSSLVMKPIKQVMEGTIQLAENNLEYRIPINQEIHCWEILNCEKRGCPAYEKNDFGCWLVDNTTCTGEKLLAREKTELCKKCPVFLAYSRNGTNLLVASFNYMADRAEKLIEELDNYETVVLTLALAVEAKDDYTSGHSERVSSYALALANELNLPEKEIEKLKIGTILHDIGKIGIPDAILRKPSSLTPEEFRVIQEHPVQGAKICDNLKSAHDSLPIVRNHHERYDGNGYPDKLKGQDIPLLVRITTIADAFDAMTSDRPYRPGMPQDIAINEMRKNSATQFDPEFVEIFIAMLEEGKINIVDLKYLDNKDAC